MSTSMSRRRFVPVAAALLTMLMGLSFGASSAQAGVALATSPDIPRPNGPVTVGQTNLPSRLTIINNSTDSQETLNVTLSNITLVPSCGVIASVDCPVAFFDPDVFSLSATGTGLAGTACAGTTFTITNIDQTQDKYLFTPSAPVVLGPSLTGGLAARCVIDFTVNVLKVPAIDARPEAGVQTNELAGANGTASDGQTGQGTGTNFTTVNRATPALATTATASATVNGTISDQATVSGRVNPVVGGTVTFNLYGPADPTCAGEPMFQSIVPLPTATDTVTSASFTPTSPGTYRWVAFYSGDANNAPVTGVCDTPGENTVVIRATPAIVTQASGPVTVGTPITDTATVSGRVLPQAGATVTFTLFGPNNATCTGAPIFTSTVGVPTATNSVTSAAFTPTSPGSYRWIAAYGGDANNAPVTGACNDANELTVVNQATPAIVTQASGPVTVGTPITDTATVSGRVLPQAGGTVTFTLFGPDNATCTGAPIFNSVVALPTDSNTVTSGPFTPTAPGSYRWIAAYSGDANNAPVTGACNDANELTVVNQATPTITTNAITTATVNGTITDNATVSGRVLPQAGATVTFTLYGPNNATCTGAPIFNSVVALPTADEHGHVRAVHADGAGDVPLDRRLQRRCQQRPGHRCLQRRQRAVGGQPGDADDHDAGGHARDARWSDHRQRHRQRPSAAAGRRHGDVQPVRARTTRPAPARRSSRRPWHCRPRPTRSRRHRSRRRRRGTTAGSPPTAVTPTTPRSRVPATTPTSCRWSTRRRRRSRRRPSRR